MKKITIGFSKSNTLLSKIIRFIEGADASHTYIQWYSDKIGRVMVYEASGTQVNFTNLFQFSKKQIIVKEFNLNISDRTYTKLLQFCIDNARTPYGVKQLVGLGWVKLMGKFGIRVGNPFGKGNYVCSTLVATILTNQLEFVIPIDIRLMSPSDILTYLTKELGE